MNDCSTESSPLLPACHFWAIQKLGLPLPTLPNASALPSICCSLHVLLSSLPFHSLTRPRLLASTLHPSLSSPAASSPCSPSFSALSSFSEHRLLSFPHLISCHFQEVLVGDESFSLEEQRPITGARGVVHLLMNGQDEVVQLNEELPRGYSITYHGSTEVHPCTLCRTVFS